jgi:hypothetical protein
MGDQQEDRMKAAMLPDGDVIGILLDQHARIKELFQEVRAMTGDTKADCFNELRALLAVHETAEQVILRPETKSAVDSTVAQARIDEEVEATKVLAELEELSVDSPAFASRFAEFEQAVNEHAEAEESQEFPVILAQYTEEERQRMGKRLAAAEKIAPTHPHPSVAGKTAATVASMPVASIIDRAKDALLHAS